VIVRPCPGCGAVFPEVAGPTHGYIESSAACWNAYGQILARQYTVPAWMELNRLTVDTYAVQHPGQLCRQSTQSVGAHLTALYAVLELGYSPKAATRLLRRAVEVIEFSYLPTPKSVGSVTVGDLLPVGTLVEHREQVTAWATSAWEAWQEHHAQVRAWVEGLEKVDAVHASAVR